MSGSALIEVRGLDVRRGAEHVFEGFDLELERGAIHVLSGANGAGKSTLLAVLRGALPFAGEVLLHWRGAATIGYVPQDFLAPEAAPLTAAELLALPRQRRPVCFGLSRATRARVDALLEGVGLGGRGNAPLAGLSGGERRRLLLAHACDPAPELLLLDEPAAGLDAAGEALLEARLRDLRGAGTTTLLVSHDPAIAARLGASSTRLGR